MEKKLLPLAGIETSFLGRPTSVVKYLQINEAHVPVVLCGYDLWWMKWHWGGFYPGTSGFPYQLSLHRLLHVHRPIILRLIISTLRASLSSLLKGRLV
jgi:hypothetical protein